MPKSRIILAIGFLLVLLPILGFPPNWDEFFMVASGLLIVLLSVLIAVDRRLTLKAKAEKRSARKRAIATSAVASSISDEVASETQDVLYGRRSTDRKLSVRDDENVPAEQFGDNAFE